MTTATATLTDTLNALLADNMVFYQKLRAFHWTVRGQEFFSLHAKFESMYKAWAQVVDDLAERVLTIGGRPLTTLAAMIEHSQIREASGAPNARAMVSALQQDLEAIAQRTRGATAEAEVADDRGTANLLDTVGDQAEKDAWMLRAWADAK
ncbi:MAG: DNA starvation/stationary phase protection protein [Phycisphaeraceae bacterium]